MGIGRILLSSQHFFQTPNLLQLPLKHPPCLPPSHAHLHTSPQGCFVQHWNVRVELCVWPPPNPHHAHHAKSQSPCICTLALEAPSCLVGALTMCPPPPINLQQHSTLHLHLHAHSEPGCTATFGRACPSMFPIAWRTFHHNSTLVQPGTMPILRPLWNQVQTLQPPYCLSIFSVGLHNPHSHPRTLSSVGGILVCCMICLQVPDLRVQALISTILSKEG